MTLSQIVKEITRIGEEHKQINFVYFGDAWERLSQQEVDYPAMFFILEPSNFSGNRRNMNFSLYFMDRVLSEETNETEVLSDMLEVAADVVAFLKHPKQDWTMADTSSLTPFTETEPDLLAGFRMDISLALPLFNDTCQVPTNYAK